MVKANKPKQLKRNEKKFEREKQTMKMADGKRIVI